MKNYLFLALTIFTCSTLSAQKLTPVAEAWAGNSVNAVVFRKNSIVTHGKTQITAFYSQQGNLFWQNVLCIPKNGKLAKRNTAEISEMRTIQSV